MLKGKKSIFIVMLLMLLSIILSNVIFSKKEKVILDEVSLLNEGSKGTSFAMYYETQQEDGTYTYVESEDTTWPTDLRYNAEKSGCIDNNGNKIDGTLTYNKETNKVTLRTKGATLCYLYFDLGTEEKPYKIQYIEDLVDLSNKVNKGETNEDAYFTLEKNLDFKQEESYRQYDRTDYGDINGVGGTEQLMTELTNPEGTGFIPIGIGKTNNVDNVFKGNFNGLKHKLENLYVHNYSDTSKRYGLFGYIYGSTIKDFELTGSVITDVTRDIGGLTSYAKRSTFENIITRVTVTSKTGSSSVGGLIGSVGEEEGSTNKIINCVNYGEISNGNNTGGLVGYLANKTSLIIEESANYGTITNNIGSHAGGLIGRDNGSTSNTTIIKSHNYGEINMIKNESTSKRAVGGLVGKSSGNTTIENSTNENKITVEALGTEDSYVGGLIGSKVTATTTLTINNSENTEKGIINIKNNQAYSNTGHINHSGGIIGVTGSITNLNNVHNKGRIRVENGIAIGQSIGGLIGWIFNQTTVTTITNSSNEISTTNEGEGIIVNPNETATNFIGGLVGRVADRSIIKIENSYNTSDIKGGTIVGGITGDVGVEKLIMNKCYNTGNITYHDSSSTQVFCSGGLIGRSVNSSNIYVLNSYNTGIITGTTNLNNKTYNFSGLIGLIDLVNGPINANIINSYNIGKVISKDFSNGMLYIIGPNESSLTIKNVYNAGDLEGKTRYSVMYNNTTGTVDIQNTYYKEASGIAESNKGDIPGAYPITDANMKNTNRNDSNSLLYKLNTNVGTLNNQGLAVYSEDLKDYTLVDWVIDPTTGYPTLNFKLEGNE